MVDRRGFFGALAGLPLAATIQPKTAPTVTGEVIGVTDLGQSPAVTYQIVVHNSRELADALAQVDLRRADRLRLIRP